MAATTWTGNPPTSRSLFSAKTLSAATWTGNPPTSRSLFSAKILAATTWTGNPPTSCPCSATTIHCVPALHTQSKILSSSNTTPIFAGKPTVCYSGVYKPKIHFVPVSHIQSKILSSSNTTPIFAGKPTASYIPVYTISEPVPSPTGINPQYPPLIWPVAIVAVGCAAVGCAAVVYKLLLSQFVVLSLKCRVPLPDAKTFSLELFYAGSGEKDARPAGISAWVETLIKIYTGVLAGRVLLNFIPNVPWEKQPMAALSQVTDPYLHIFQNTAPLVLFSLDVSPIIPFVLLGVLGLLVKLL